jgi:hypothetical protein
MGEPNAMWYGGPHAEPPNHCVAGTCATKHGEGLCEGPPEFALQDLEILRGALAREDASSAGAVLSRHQDHIRVNGERQAVQVMNCSGEVVAHFPVSAGFVASLTRQIRST